MGGLLFAGFAYLCFNLVSVALALFLAGLWLPFTVDASIWPSLSPWHAGAIDLGLIALFGLQHSVMARQGFKRRLGAVVPAYLERAVYVFVTCLPLALLVLCWQPLPATIWHSTDDFVVTLLWVLYGIGWLMVVASTHMIDHFELFGLAQPLRHWRGRAAPVNEFRTPYLYRHMRHPLYFSMLIAFWATPQMSLGHLLFAAGMTAYILVGIAFEERDLVATFGERYRAYRARVPALIPGIRI
ncbi:MAG: isoprenylcysteine carboxylmethyltransferase family protein [Ferrovibrio sp.]